MRLANGDFRFVGTAFLVARQFKSDPDKAFTYTVTARHVLDGARGLGLDRLYLRGTGKDGAGLWWDTRIDDWILHPGGPAIDVGILRASPPREQFDIKVMPVSMIATEEALSGFGLGAGDEVAIVGLFAPHAGTERNIPIVRIGNIAAMPSEPVSTSLGPMSAFLIEARSIGGLSGSPVLVQRPPIASLGGEIVIGGGPDVQLLGLMHGHFDATLGSRSLPAPPATEEARINMGVGIVVPARQILDILNLPSVLEAEAQIEKTVGDVSSGGAA